MKIEQPKGILKKVSGSTPIPFSGLMLGLASAGNLFPEYRWTFGFLAFSILALLLLKLTLDHYGIGEELKNQDTIGMMCALPTATSILSLHFSPSMPELGYWFLMATLLLHLAFILHFTLNFLPKSEL